MGKDQAYADRLIGISAKRFKKILQPINPYRLHIRRIVSGSILEVGSGIGRNLGYLDGQDVIGVDVNQVSVAYSVGLGYRALSVADFELKKTDYCEAFDYLLFSHVLEHMDHSDALAILREYLCYLKPGGGLVVICPQEKGFLSDNTHVSFLESKDIQILLEAVDCRVITSRSFPLPRRTGKFFIYNETVVCGVKLERDLLSQTKTGSL